jgi:hypothetical protein
MKRFMSTSTTRKKIHVLSLKTKNRCKEKKLKKLMRLSHTVTPPSSLEFLRDSTPNNESYG